MKLTQHLTDYAKVSDGKLDLLGAGWTITGPGPIAFVVAGMLQIPYDQTVEAKHVVRLELLDADGVPVNNPLGPIYFEITVEIDRTEESPVGVPADIPFVAPFGPLQLRPGGRYEIRTTVNGNGDEDWSLPFSIRHAEPEQLAA